MAVKASWFMQIAKMGSSREYIFPRRALNMSTLTEFREMYEFYLIHCNLLGIILYHNVIIPLLF